MSWNATSTVSPSTTARTRPPEEAGPGVKMRYVSSFFGVGRDEGKGSWERDAGVFPDHVKIQAHTNNSCLILGSLLAPDSASEDALQAHRRSPQEDGARLPVALPSAQPRQQQTQAYDLHVVVFLVHRPLAYHACHHPFAYSRVALALCLALRLFSRLWCFCPAAFHHVPPAPPRQLSPPTRYTA